MAASAAWAGAYENGPFGFALQYPAHWRLCPPDPNDIDHGPILLFDRRNAGGCTDDTVRAGVDIFAWYNWFGAPSTLRAMFKFECRLTPRARCRRVPLALKFGRFRSLGGELEKADGELVLLVLAQRPPEGTIGPPGVDYFIDLHTDRSHYLADLARLKRLLKTVRIAPHLVDVFGLTSPSVKSAP
ncbi:MAG: hypothetical protein ACREEW_05060 [Caulobacteraceae bacterium]